MNWFDDQVKHRKEIDEEVLTSAYLNMAGAIVGRRLQQAWQDETVAARSALQEICKFYHVKYPEIPEKITDLNAQLDYVFQPHGMMRREVELTGDWYRDGFGAMLATRREDGKVVALIPSQAGGYTLTDLDTGKTVRVNAQRAKTLDPEALVFYRPLPLRKLSVKDLAAYMLQALVPGDIFWFLASMAIITLLGMLTPKLNHALFSEVVDYSSTTLLLAVMLFMAMATISTQLFSAVKQLLLSRISVKVDLAVQSAAFMRILSLPANFFKNYTSGELQQILSYFNSLCATLVSTVFSTAFTGLFSLVYIFQITKYAPSLVVPALLVTLATLLLSFVTILAQMKVSKELMEENARERGLVLSLISGIQKIRLSGAEGRVFANWGNRYSRILKLRYHPTDYLTVESVLVSAVSMVGTIFMYYYAVKGGVSVADYYAFNAAFAYVTTAFSALAGIASAAATVKPTLEIIRPLMEAEPEITAGKQVVEQLTGRIELNNVCFRYDPNSPWLLDHVSLKIKRGEYVAIVGKTGCGKSTLMRLLLGFETPARGSIYYDGIDLESMDKRSFRRKIGVVMQSNRLITGDIFSNITIAAPWLTLDDAWEAAEMADIADDIRAMPMGMNTLIQEGAGGISGGQRQRLMIARALVTKPKILFMDEATSALDNISQAKVSASLDAMKRTRIVIAHRLSTIRQCDRIIVLDKGKIVEDGSYDRLIANGGFFAELVERQKVE